MAAGQIYQGKAVRLSFDGKTLYHATSCSLSISTSLEEIATKDTDGTISVPGNYSWSVTTNALVADKPNSSTTSVDYYDLSQLQLAGTPVEIEFTDGATGSLKYAGQVYIESNNMNMEVGTSGSSDFSFKGNGTLTLERVV
jgi:hypothetical protein